MGALTTYRFTWLLAPLLKECTGPEDQARKNRWEQAQVTPGPEKAADVFSTVLSPFDLLESRRRVQVDVGWPTVLGVVHGGTGWLVPSLGLRRVVR